MSGRQRAAQRKPVNPGADAFDVLAQLAAVVRKRARACAETERAAQLAIDANAARAVELHNAVTAYRALCAAVSDSAGYDRAVDLPTALDAARALVGADE